MKSTVSLMGISVMAKILEEMEILSIAEKGIERINDLSISLNKLNGQAVGEMQMERASYV
jgi:hypothetical protein